MPKGISGRPEVEMFPPLVSQLSRLRGKGYSTYSVGQAYVCNFWSWMRDKSRITLWSYVWFTFHLGIGGKQHIRINFFISLMITTPNLNWSYVRTVFSRVFASRAERRIKDTPTEIRAPTARLWLTPQVSSCGPAAPRVRPRSTLPQNFSCKIIPSWSNIIVN